MFYRWEGRDLGSLQAERQETLETSIHTEGEKGTNTSLISCYALSDELVHSGEQDKVLLSCNSFSTKKTEGKNKHYQQVKHAMIKLK